MKQSQQGPRILVVEDDADQRQLLCEALALHYGDRRGCIVGVPDARQCMERDLSAFDVILLDLHLPDMAGLDLLDSIVKAADVPVVIVTGENDREVVAQALAHGAQDFVVKLGDYLFAIPALVQKNISQHHLRLENRKLQQDLEGALKELRLRNQQLQETLATVQALATTDPLTRLANRRRFVEVLGSHFSEAVRYRFDLTCCMCDLDNYKELNDALGHQVGDEVLITTADVIRGSLRSSDVAARYGGDEFVLLLPHTPLERGLAVGERIRRQLVAETAKYAGKGPLVTMSVGVASLGTDHPTSPDALVSLADQALYAAKARGKDQIVSFQTIRAPAAK